MSLAPFVRILGRGPGRSRSLTREEAREAMALALEGRVARESVGALLMLMRYRGETAAEVAGFADALRASLPDWDGERPGLDWPSYAAGRSRGLPWFLLAAKLVVSSGVPVLVHGWNSHQSERASVRGALDGVGIPVAADWRDASAKLASGGITYLPLETISPEALALLRLREVLGLRSAINTVLRVLNPAGAPASVQGVFHPPYRALQADAGRLLGQLRLTILKGGGGEFERHPSKAVELFGLRDGADWTGTALPLLSETRRLAKEDARQEDLGRLWCGELQDPFATAVVIGTAALALETAGAVPEGSGQGAAEALWRGRAVTQV